MAGVALLLISAATPTQAVTVTGDVRANILASLSFTKGDTLDFGSISPGASASIVRIAPSTGARTLVSGDATLVTGGTENDGTFIIDGIGGLNVSVDIPVSTTVLGGFVPMTVDNFSWSYNGGTASNADGAVALIAGPSTLSIGADLHVGGSQDAAIYTGIYSVTVNYQ